MPADVRVANTMSQIANSVRTLLSRHFVLAVFRMIAVLGCGRLLRAIALAYAAVVAGGCGPGDAGGMPASAASNGGSSPQQPTHAVMFDASIPDWYGVEGQAYTYAISAAGPSVIIDGPRDDAPVSCRNTTTRDAVRVTLETGTSTASGCFGSWCGSGPSTFHTWWAELPLSDDMNEYECVEMDRTVRILIERLPPLEFVGSDPADGGVYHSGQALVLRFSGEITADWLAIVDCVMIIDPWGLRAVRGSFRRGGDPTTIQWTADRDDLAYGVAPGAMQRPIEARIEGECALGARGEKTGSAAKVTLTAKF